MSVVPNGGPLVVGFDGSEHAVLALSWAADEGRARKCPLIAVYIWHLPRVYGSYSLVPPDRVDAAAMARQELSEAIGKLGLRDIEIELVCRDGETVELLKSEAAQREASMLVVGSRGHGGFTGLLVGSVSDELAQWPRQPLVVVRPPSGSTRETAPGGRRIVVGVDGSSNSAVALRWALADAQIRGGSIDAVMAWSFPPADVRSWGRHDLDALAKIERGGQEALAAQVADLGDLDAVEVRQATREGHPAQALLHEAEGADLLVVGTRGLAASERLRLGSTSRALLHHAHIPLAIIPDIIDVSPTDRAH